MRRTKYFYDTEFSERGPQHPIDLISIGIISEDGREFYAISADFDWDTPSDWVKENVLIHLPSPYAPDARLYYNTRAEIADRLYKFMNPAVYGKPELWAYYGAYDHVVLCQIFGTMSEMPEGLPYYTRDLKQWCDSLGNPKLPEQVVDKHHALADARWVAHAWAYLDLLSKEQAWLSMPIKEKLS